MTSSVQTVTARIIRQLYSDGHVNKAVLASIRHASSMTSQRAQSVWPIMMARLDPEMLSKNGKPTYAEVAIYAAIRFYAIQQQGVEPCVYGSSFKEVTESGEGITLFQALANLRRNEEVRVALDRRVQPLLATTNVTSVINTLAHLVSILKADNRLQKIDYARLAQDLYWFQLNYEQASRVRLQWGQQYFRPAQTITEIEKEQN